MRIGKSLHIGVNVSKLDSRELKYCEADALAMQAIAIEQGFGTTRTLLSKEALYERVVEEISVAAVELESEDIFWVSFAGHGVRVLDGSGDEYDGYDESWLLSDLILTDDELHHLWSQFRPGVRLLIVLDCCHSGGIDIPLHSNFPKIAASGIMLASCSEPQYSREGDNHGFFTENLLRIWDKGKFRKSYKRLNKQINESMGERQNSQYIRFGTTDRNFTLSKPFRI